MFISGSVASLRPAISDLRIGCDLDPCILPSTLLVDVPSDALDSESAAPSALAFLFPCLAVFVSLLSPSSSLSASTSPLELSPEPAYEVVAAFDLLTADFDLDGSAEADTTEDFSFLLSSSLFVTETGMVRDTSFSWLRPIFPTLLSELIKETSMALIS